MADSKAFTGTPDTVSGNAVDVVTVTNANSDIVDRQVMAIGDASSLTRVVVGASGMQVMTGPVVVSGTVTVGGTLSATQGTSPWVIGGPVTLATGSAIIGALTANQSVTIAATAQVALATGSAAIGTVAQGTAGASAWLVTGIATIAGPVTLATGTAVIGALSANQSVTGSVVLTTGAAVIGALTANQSVTGTVAASVTQVTSPWIISGGVSLATAAATIGQVGLVTGAAVIGALATGTATLGQVALTTGAAIIGALVTNQTVLPHNDVGRTFVTFTFVSVTCVTTEALATMQINKGGTLTSGTTYAVTTGKTFRLQSAMLGVIDQSATAVAITARMTVRTASTVTVASAQLFHLVAGLQGIPAASVQNLGGNSQTMDIPDGIELAALQQIGLSHLDTAITGEITASIIGYEY